MQHAWIFGSVAVISLISLAGAFTLTLGVLRRHVVLVGLVALAAGALIGDALIHLLPEAVEANPDGFTPALSLMVIAGFLAFFLLETALRWTHGHGEMEHPHEAQPAGIAPFAWTNLVGDGFHNFIDGVLVAVAFTVDVKVGLGAALAVALHEIPQELGDFAVLIKAGLRPARALAYNLVSALLALAGAAVVVFAGLDTEMLELYALPIIAGGFLYIAAADLVPELHHHAGPRYVPTVLTGLALGILMMVGLLRFDVPA